MIPKSCLLLPPVNDALASVSMAVVPPIPISHAVHIAHTAMPRSVNCCDVRNSRWLWKFTVAESRHSKCPWAQTAHDQNRDGLETVLKTIRHDHWQASFEQDPELMTNKLEFFLGIICDAVSLAGYMVII